MGLGRADITPPPGPALLGWGPEGQRSNGLRTHLYARAMVLEDQRGERVAFVVADLNEIPGALPREVVKHFKPDVLAYDRLFISATHTHSGPGNFFGIGIYDDFGTTVSGYDRGIARFVTDGIVVALRQALGSMRPAEARWGSTYLRDYTWNRSYQAFLKDTLRVDAADAAAPPPQPDSLHAADSTFTMLRVDTLDAEGAPHPAAALSVYAIHATAVPNGNDLFDGDIHALVERVLERHIDGAGVERLVPRAVHLFANGAEGDVSPRWPEDSRCPVPKLSERVFREKSLLFGGKGPFDIRLENVGRADLLTRLWADTIIWQRPPQADLDRCVESAVAYTGDTGRRLGREAVELFDRLAPGANAPPLQIARVFSTIHLDSLSQQGSLCAPRSGTAEAIGAEDGRSRLYKLQVKLDDWLVVPPGLEEGGTARLEGKASTGCADDPKRTLLGQLQQPLAGKWGYPRSADVAVLRLGPKLIVTMPGEVTTEMGRRIRRLVADSAGVPFDDVVVIGMTNGFIGYIPTPEEYAEQNYEGGSAIYGGQTGSVLAGVLARSAVALRAGGASSPRASRSVVAFGYEKRGVSSSLPGSSTRGQAPAREPRLACQGSWLVGTWDDGAPGRVWPAAGPIVAVAQADRPDAFLATDELGVEVRFLGAHDGRYTWSARWRPDGQAGPFVLTLLARRGEAEVRSEPHADCGVAPEGPHAETP